MVQTPYLPAPPRQAPPQQAPPPQVPPPPPPWGVPPGGAPLPTPPKKRNTWLYVLAGLLAVVVIAAGTVLFLAARSGTDSRWEAGPTPTQAAPTRTGEAPATGGSMIKAASGTFEITGVTTADRYPENCVAGDVSCNIAIPGYQVLLVKLAPVGAVESPAFVQEGLEAYVVSAEGVRSDAFVVGRTYGSGESDLRDGEVGFMTPTAEKGFTLYWPGSDPVKLGR